MADKIKKTPSPKVIASKALYQAIQNAMQATPEYLSGLMDSRVSPEKTEKVKQQMETVGRKFVERLTKTLNKFNGETEAPAPKAKKSPPSEAPAPKKKKKKNG